MTDKERLAELIEQGDKAFSDKYTGEVMSHIDELYEFIADHILADGWIRPPYEIGAKVYATIGSLSLPIPYAVYEVTIQRYVLVKGGLVPVVKLKKGAVTYGDIHTSIDRMYDTREEAEKALKGGEQE